MRVAKPSQEALDAVTTFVHACEYFLEREKFSLKEPYQCWEDDDEDRKEIEAIRDNILRTEDVRKEDIDDRIIAYEYLSRKYSNRLSHVNLTAHVLVDNCCDPQ